MMGLKGYFIKLEEKLNFFIELGDNSKYHAISIGIIKFQRESRKPLLVEDVLYVLERIGLSLHQNIDISMSDTTNSIIYLKEMAKTYHESCKGCWVISKKPLPSVTHHGLQDSNL